MPNFPRLELIKKACDLFRGSLEKCSICPRRCGANRRKGPPGYCGAPANPVVYSYLPHHGEEPPISGLNGSGTIFFSHCNMKCAYCQNYYFSQLGAGKEISVDRLSEIMLHLQDSGCHNINLVSPTHFVPQILLALDRAVGAGLDIPIVYNTGGYELVDTLRALEGIVDVYLPDMRYSDDEMARRYSDAVDYIRFNREAVIEMARQVGPLVLDEGGVAKRGIVVRLLALPGDTSGAKATMKFIKDRIGGDTYLSIMSQYYPTFKAYNYVEISRGVTKLEYKNIVDYAKFLGLNNGWIQDEPLETDTRFFGTNIPPKEDI